ncbi:pacifastin-like protease inhibitor cvp4 [Anopheles funestus]|uniref:pacifastin-like protease inhibitor cvp4 n=1 Tax=Anopheles funestus TaxID=62324 RepID=UPI0020C6F203|nr:pacifastin-like protease inhibitor cvp4 [Anopheles funestus]
MMKLLILIVATCVVGALCEEKCEPGTTFMEDCNRCRCGLDGQKSCTRKACPPNELSDDSQVRADVQNGDSLSSADEKEEVHDKNNGQVCTPNEIKMKDCNRCRCANNGIGWFCTRRACPPREKRSAPSPDEKCVPGTVFRSEDDCNTCFCSDIGTVACTRKACVSAPPEKTKRETVPSTSEKCTPGTVFQSEDGCNSCFCTDTGMAACTLKACYSAPPQKTKREALTTAKCTPGKVFQSEDGCNTCLCTETGVAACTMMACYSETAQKTKRETLPQSDIAPGAPGFSCQPKSSFKYQCNTCLCSDDGKMAGCTFKYCIPGEW